MYANTEIEFVPDLSDGYSLSIQIQALIKTFQVHLNSKILDIYNFVCIFFPDITKGSPHVSP